MGDMQFRVTLQRVEKESFIPNITDFLIKRAGFSPEKVKHMLADLPRILAAGLNLNEAGVGRADGRAVAEAHLAAIGVNHDAFDHAGRRLAGVNGGKLVQRVFFGRGHAIEHVGDDGVRVHGNRRDFGGAAETG